MTVTCSDPVFLLSGVLVLYSPNLDLIWTSLPLELCFSVVLSLWDSPVLGLVSAISPSAAARQALFVLSIILCGFCPSCAHPACLLGRTCACVRAHCPGRACSPFQSVPYNPVLAMVWKPTTNYQFKPLVF